MAPTPNRNKPSFFTALLGDFSTILEIPSHWVAKRHESLSRSATLRTRNASFEVSVKRTRKDGELRLFFHGAGWVDFLEVNRFKQMDFLVFTLVADSVFDVLDFGQTACLKNRRIQNPIANGNSSNTVRDGGGGGSSGCGSSSCPPPAEKARSPHFEVTMDSFNMRGLIVPADFAAATRLGRRKTVAVEDWKAGVWAVEVAKESGGRILLEDGWGRLVKENGLKIGATCLIQTVMQYDDLLVLSAKLL